MIALGCKAGTPYLCNDLGAVLFNQASGPPETRAEAFAALDRACALGDVFCGMPATVRAHPALVAGCERGGIAACDTFDRYALDDPDAPLVPADARFGPLLSPEEEAELARREGEAEEAAER